MRTLLYIWQKEFLQIVRNRSILPVLIILPVFQMLILVYAATFDMKNINLAIIDQDLSTTSRNLVTRFSGSPFFTTEQRYLTTQQGFDALEKGEVHALLIFKPGFEKDLVRDKQAKVMLSIDAVNNTVAELIMYYSTSIIQDYNMELVPVEIRQRMHSPVNISPRFWYNPTLNYKFYMAPGVLVVLVTIIGMILSSLNMVREKEIGTIEQINVTPIHKYQFILGKLIPFWIIGIVDLSFGLVVARILFHIPMVGNMGVLALFSSVYLFTVLAFGLLLSTISETQQQVTFLAFFFIIVFILMSGLFTPTDSMPEWAKILNLLNPLYYFVKIMRSILLKGSQFNDLKEYFFILLGYGALIMSLAIRRYRKTA